MEGSVCTWKPQLGLKPLEPDEQQCCPHIPPGTSLTLLHTSMIIGQNKPDAVISRPENNVWINLKTLGKWHLLNSAKSQNQWKPRSLTHSMLQGDSFYPTSLPVFKTAGSEFPWFSSELFQSFFQESPGSGNPAFGELSLLLLMLTSAWVAKCRRRGLPWLSTPLSFEVPMAYYWVNPFMQLLLCERHIQPKQQIEYLSACTQPSALENIGELIELILYLIKVHTLHFWMEGNITGAVWEDIVLCFFAILPGTHRWKAISIPKGSLIDRSVEVGGMRRPEMRTVPIMTGSWKIMNVTSCGNLFLAPFHKPADGSRVCGSPERQMYIKYGNCPHSFAIHLHLSGSL